MKELEDLIQQINNDAQTLRDKITELTDSDEFYDKVPPGAIKSYQDFNNALCDFIGDI